MFISKVGKYLARSAPRADVPKTTSYCDDIKLKVVNQIALNSPTDTHLFRSEGTDPYFSVFSQSGRQVVAGWYCVFIYINTIGTSHSAKLYADFGAGCSEEDAYRIAFKPGQPVIQVLHFPQHVQHLRLDPIEVAADFELVSFQLAPLLESSATELMLNTLSAVLVGSGGKKRQVNTLRDELAIEATASGAPFSSYVYQMYLKEVAPAPSYGSSGASYQSWIDQVERPSLHSNEVIAQNIERWKFTPKVSVIVPVYNTDAEYLKLCIDSVINQSYPNWELCVADDCSSKAHVADILKEYETIESRIKVVYRSENGHISEATNSALNIATGEYVALVDHDDTLAKDALYHIVEVLNDKPEAQIIYTDEDWTDAMGHRIRPHFKSDWNPDLLFSHNYITHLCVYRLDLVTSLGGLRTGVEGSQDYDLLLRSITRVSKENIVHVPRVLYHWRAIEGSTALSAGEKSYSDDAGLIALKDHFDTFYTGQANVECSDLPNMYRVHWQIPQPEPLVSLLMPTRDQKRVTEVAVRSILEKTDYTNFELIIINNGSEKQETLDFFAEIQAEDDRVKVIDFDEPFNYPAINNFGVEHAKGSLIGLINNDVEVVTESWLREMVSHALRPEIGCVGAKLYYENDSVQHGGVIIGIGGVAGHSHRGCPRYESGYVGRLFMVQNLSAVTAACLLVKKTIYDEVGGLDEENLKVAFNDVDFCLKVREAGYRNLWTPFAELYHYESVSRGYEDTPEKLERFDTESEFMKGKWGDMLSCDPYYSPNLTLSREDFSLDVGGVSE